MEINRQQGIFDAEAFGDTQVHVIGAGGIGSWLSLRLVDMRVRNVHVWDGDVVESHNTQNQIYTQTWCIGKKKVDALQFLLHHKSHVSITTHAMYVTAETTNLSGVVCLCVDSMDARKMIWDACIRDNPDVHLLIDARMDASLTDIFTLDPRLKLHRDMWEYYWFPHSEAQNATMACGSPLAVAPTASRVADDAMWQIIRHHARATGKNVPLPNRMWHDMWKMTHEHETWED